MSELQTKIETYILGAITTYIEGVAKNKWSPAEIQIQIGKQFTDEIMQLIQEERETVIEKIQWELSDLLITEREMKGHVDLAKYIKRLHELKQSLAEGKTIDIHEQAASKFVKDTKSNDPIEKIADEKEREK